MKNRLSSDGKGLEKLVELIYETIKDNPWAKVLRDKKLPKKTKGKAQFDVLIESNIAGEKIYVAIECKDFNKPVTVKEIRDFKCRCDLVSGVGRKIVVAVNGYQTGAKDEAQEFNIGLYHLNEISSSLLESWIATDSIRLAYYDKKQFAGLIFYNLEGKELPYRFDEIDERAELYNSTQFLGYLGEVVTDSVHGLYRRSGDAIADLVNSEFHKLDISGNPEELTVTLEVPLYFPDRVIRIVWDSITFSFQRLDIIIEYLYKVHLPSKIVARAYQKEADKQFAETVSGVVDKLSFEIIKSSDTGQINMYTILPSGDVIEMRRTQ